MSGPYGPAVESASKADADAAWSSFEQCCAPGCICFPGSSVGKESACNAGDQSLILGSGRSPEERNGNPLQYSCLENPVDRETWQATVHGVTRVGDDYQSLIFRSSIPVSYRSTMD